MKPTQGFLNAGVLNGEKVEPGDIIVFESQSENTPNAVLEITALQKVPTWLPDLSWLGALVSEAFADGSGTRCVLLAPGDPNLPDLKTIRLSVGALEYQMEAGRVEFTGQWRVQVTPPSAGDSTRPLLTFGIQDDVQIKREAQIVGLDPPDLQGWAVEYVSDAIGKLAALGKTKGMKLVIEKDQ